MRLIKIILAVIASLWISVQLVAVPAPAGQCCASKNSETACLPCREGRGA